MPDEILMSIFARLSCKDLCQARKVRGRGRDLKSAGKTVDVGAKKTNKKLSLSLSLFHSRPASVRTMPVERPLFSHGLASAAAGQCRPRSRSTNGTRTFCLFLPFFFRKRKE
jgi:hypothetical protein